MELNNNISPLFNNDNTIVLWPAGCSPEEEVVYSSMLLAFSRVGTTGSRLMGYVQWAEWMVVVQSSSLWTKVTGWIVQREAQNTTTSLFNDAQSPPGG